MSIEEQRRRTSADANTYVFWDIVDFPLHGEEVIDSFTRKVESFLEKEGYDGEISITAYGHRDLHTPIQMESVHPSIQLLRRTSRFARLNNLLVDVVDCTRIDPQANLMLIMKHTPEDEDINFVKIIKALIKRKYNVFLVVGDDQDQDNCAYPPVVLYRCTIWTWTSLLASGDDEDDDEEDDEEGSSLQRLNISDDEEGSSPTPLWF